MRSLSRLGGIWMTGYRMAHRRAWACMVACAAWALCAAAASAQPEGPPPEPGRNLPQLALEKSVREELKLTDDEADKLKPLVQKSQALSRGFRDLSPQERRKKIRETSQAKDQMVAEVLEPQQFKRLKQISWQLLGPDVFRDPLIIDGLVLTAEQQDKADDIRRQGREEMGKLGEEFRKNGINADLIDKFKKIQRETRDKIAALLTPEQKTKWEEMLGSPFTGKLDSSGFGL
jgi:Spy/CpxP family protein refolding chaperone